MLRSIVLFPFRFSLSARAALDSGAGAGAVPVPLSRASFTVRWLRSSATSTPLDLLAHAAVQLVAAAAAVIRMGLSRKMLAG